MDFIKSALAGKTMNRILSRERTDVKSMINRRFGLCAAPILLFLVDISLTLWGQPADYWAGNYAAAIEGSPEVRRVMQIHPALLFAMIAVWMGVIVLLVQSLPRLPAELFSVSTVIAHTACASHWLSVHFTFAYQLTIALSIAAACLVVVSVRAGRPQPTEDIWKPTRMVWCFVTFILSAIAFAVLYPH